MFNWNADRLRLRNIVRIFRNKQLPYAPNTLSRLSHGILRALWLLPLAAEIYLFIGNLILHTTTDFDAPATVSSLFSIVLWNQIYLTTLFGLQNQSALLRFIVQIILLNFCSTLFLFYNYLNINSILLAVILIIFYSRYVY